MKCKLCLQDKDLLKKSHIVPNFLYKELREKDNSFVKANLEKLTKQPVYTGFFEPNILCQTCDNELLSKLEEYAYKIIYDSKKIKGVKIVNEINSHGVEWTMCRGVDYTKLKLFLLSMLWRFSISSNEFYKFVDLGKHEEIIRKMIFENNAGDVLDYPCSISSYRKHTDLPFKLMSQPLRHRNENGGICYTVVMQGFCYTFYISRELLPDIISEIVINKNNELKVIHLPKDSATKIVRKYMRLNV